MQIETAHCLFEQSGTFKNEFIKLGINAIDYDICNDYGQTDRQCNLFSEIRGGYEEKPSIFDSMTENDIVLAFFPCTRFEDQVILHFRGEASQQKKWDDVTKLENDLKLHLELHQNYELITKLAIICLKRNIKLIFENPYSTQHYLTRYWALKPSIVDTDRTLDGDYYKKPTQYWFIGCKPKENLVFEPIDYVPSKNITKIKWDENRARIRSEIHPQYANRFIRKYIIDGG